ncbi:putative ABC transporter permease protein YtcP [Spirochaetia bacterium]|nr:putative ABC transporter permease protein YtcP [Spirochaetia bacterium]
MKLYKFTLFDACMYVIGGLVALACFLPFVYVFSVSFTDPSIYVPFEFTLIPKKFSLEVYKGILADGGFLQAIKNTVIVTVGGTVISLFATFAYAYGLTKKDMPFAKLFMGLVIFGLLFDAGIIPNYMVIRSLGLIDSFWSLILTAVIISWNVIIAKAFMDGIPQELEDAAKIDGCSHFGIFFRIILPLATASVAVLTLFIAVNQWNMYVRPMMYINDFQKRTIQVFLKTLLVDSTTGIGGGGSGDGNNVLPSETIRLATVVLAMLPIMIVYPFVQRYFVKGVMVGSVKG